MTEIAIFDFSFAAAFFLYSYFFFFFLESVLCKHLHHQSSSNDSIRNLEHFQTFFPSFYLFIFQFLKTVLSQSLHFTNSYCAKIQASTPNRNSNFRRFLLLHLLQAGGVIYYIRTEAVIVFLHPLFVKVVRQFQRVCTANKKGSKHFFIYYNSIDIHQKKKKSYDKNYKLQQKLKQNSLFFVQLPNKEIKNHYKIKRKLTWDKYGRYRLSFTFNSKLFFLKR